MSGGLVSRSRATTSDSAGPADYELTIRLTRNTIELHGSVPDAPATATIVAAVAAAFPDRPLTTGLVPRPDAPPRFADAAKLAIDLMTRLAEGEASLGDGRFAVSGAAFHGSAKAELLNALATGWPEGYETRDVNVTAGPSGPAVAAPDCEAAIKTAIDGRGIAFEVGRAQMRADSRPALDHVAYEAARCPDALISVAGHTDSDAAADANHRLSLERARAVADLLIAEGVATERITVLGYGESRPLASNGSEAGKARNRRIEFVLRN
ncbi:OmpA family protein [Microbaculum marinisediminis]|uniref:OmpA family protein n=1 Tax=Microbaculum marinisediminis TaxID=2931392 RepID=A0AAW5QZK2_9HYPH|nr:OmpA family protein [Microbaculum sp. A6E488]MCT8972999.1 OmpA family protein [Microbaculum sp. A6E488]